VQEEHHEYDQHEEHDRQLRLPEQLQEPLEHLIPGAGLTVGRSTVAVTNAERSGDWVVGRLYRQFLHVGGDPTLDLSVAPLDRGVPADGAVAFDSGLGWRVVETTDGWSFVGLRASRAYHAIAVDREWRTGTVFLPARLRAGIACPFPVAYPWEMLLFTSLLAHGHGAIVHATAVVVDGAGWVFAGPHRAGKSTLARLFKTRPDVTVLNDDRVAVRHVLGRWHVFGTPWAGSARLNADASAPIRGVCLIRHGRATRPTRLAPGRAAAALLARCLHPYWERAAASKLLDTIARLVTEVPCYDFPFAPRLGSVLRGLQAAER